MTNNNIFHNNNKTLRDVAIITAIIVLTFILGMSFQGKENQVKGLEAKLTYAQENPKIVEVERTLKEDNFVDVMTYIAKRFEKYGKKAVAEAIAISYLESKWSAGATNENWRDGVLSSTDRGYWQINDKAHPTVTEACARDLECSTDYAIKLYERQGFSPWVASKVTAYFW